MENVKENRAGQYVVFSLNNQLCGVSIEEIVEIIRIQTITEVAGIASYISGMINLRGNIIPVLNVRKRYQLQPAPFDKKSRIIIVKDDGEDIGLIVDEVKMVTYVEDEQVEPPIEMFNTLEKDNFIGFAKVGEQLIGILNIQKVLYPNGSNEEVNRNV